MGSRALNELLREPIESVRQREQNALDELLDRRSRKVVLFGAGTLGRRALPLLRDMECIVEAFSDNSPAAWSAEIDGVPVLSPSEAAARYGSSALFLVTIWNDRHWFSETYSKLSSLGCDLVSSYAPLFWKFPDRFLQLYLLNELPHKLYADAAAVLAGENLWADEDSLNCYRANIRWRALGDPRDLPGRPDESTYFPKDLFQLGAGDNVADCGAFDGDTIREILTRFGQNPPRVEAIEADALSYVKLSTYVKNLGAEFCSRIHLHKCAIGKERGFIRFEGTGNLTSKASDSGLLVEQIPIDELFEQARLTMIKMDIEGAEYEALRGAERVIKRDQPILAVCVYHTQSDIWRIPLLVKSMVPEHRFYLRSYEGDGFQTVMYAVPPNRLVSVVR